MHIYRYLTLIAYTLTRNCSYNNNIDNKGYNWRLSMIAMQLMAIESLARLTTPEAAIDRPGLPSFTLLGLKMRIDLKTPRNYNDD